jgi:hypothetical protein
MQVRSRVWVRQYLPKMNYGPKIDVLVEQDRDIHDNRRNTVKPPITRTTDNLKNLSERPHLTSWKEIAEYMRCGVRTVQRYEREFGLPVRRPTGKSRGSVMATRAEIDAWVAAGPIRETFRLTRTELNSLTRSQAKKLEDGVIAMRKLKAEMLALRAQTRSALKLLLDRVSAVHLLMPPSRPDGYGPLVSMDTDIDMKRRFHKKGKNQI